MSTDTLPGNAADPAEVVLPSLMPSEERYLAKDLIVVVYEQRERRSPPLPS